MVTSLNELKKSDLMLIMLIINHILSELKLSHLFTIPKHLKKVFFGPARHFSSFFGLRHDFFPDFDTLT
jgi:hypothetical protein